MKLLTDILSDSGVRFWRNPDIHLVSLFLFTPKGQFWNLVPSRMLFPSFSGATYCKTYLTEKSSHHYKNYLRMTMLNTDKMFSVRATNVSRERSVLGFGANFALLTGRNWPGGRTVPPPLPGLLTSPPLPGPLTSSSVITDKPFNILHDYPNMVALVYLWDFSTCVVFVSRSRFRVCLVFFKPWRTGVILKDGK